MYFKLSDFISGGSVYSKIKNNRPNPTTAKLIFAEIVSFIDALHREGVLHLDVQTNNILIDSDGHLVLTDFGMAKQLQHINDTTKDWRFLYDMCGELFIYPIRNENEENVKEMFYQMTDLKLNGKSLKSIYSFYISVYP